MTLEKFNPFLFYSSQLQALLTKAAKQKDPALWLYNNKARTTLFMLEGLTRIHNKAFDEKIFLKWNKRFKKLEDLFGGIDEYTMLHTELKTNKKVNKEILKYFSVHSSNYISKCNQRLLDKDWLNHKMLAFDKKLSTYNVEYNQEYCDALRFALIDEVDAILEFVLKSGYQFAMIEQVHEVRRKLRWLSIYAMSLRGLIQLKKPEKKVKTSIHYFTKEILQSPYNKLEVKPKKAAVILYDKDSFFALSWLINELGKLKDKGIMLEQLRDAIYITQNVTQEQAKGKAIGVLSMKSSAESDLLEQSSLIIKTALEKDKILDRLIIG